jgi:hypothetical protein
MADTVRENRVPLAEDTPAIRAERATLAAVGRQAAQMRELRDEVLGQVFRAVYAADTKPGDSAAKPEK